MPTHLGGDYEPTPFRSMEDHLAKAGRLATENLRVKGSSFDVSTDRKTSLLRDRPAEGVRSSAPYRIWVSDAAHHCVQLRVDLLFTLFVFLFCVFVVCCVFFFCFWLVVCLWCF